MNAKIIDGKAVSAKIRAELKQRITRCREQGLPAPGLAVILVGNNPASSLYVQRKRQACQEVGIHSLDFDLSSDVKTEDLLVLIDNLNTDPQVHGILVQLPLPPHVDTNRLIERISPFKDVDGFHPYNLGRLAQKASFLRPCTPYGVIQLLEHYQLNVSGMNAVIVGASNIVGRPMALELLNAGCTITVCHSRTKNLAQIIEQADLLVSATGNPETIKSEWIKPGAIVIDVGINRTDDGRLVGDIDFASASQRASWITPVPGGVGPMTVATLLKNTVFALENLNSKVGKGA